MRNLKIVGRSLVRFSTTELDPLPLTASAWDAASDELICAFGPSESRAVIELKRLQPSHQRTEHSFKHIASWDAPCPLPSLSCDAILDLHHFSDSSTSCLVLAGGDIILVRESPLSGEELVEIVGSVDAGIYAAAWSPDEELLAIVTRADTLLFMTREIENVVSVQLTPDDVKVSNHVSVGWGKSETQFKGKRAKALQDPTMPERIDEGTLSPYDDNSVNISWRGDGAFVAINSIEQGKRRMIRVYSREGQIDSVSEPVDGLEGAISWRPSGNLVAGVRRLEDRIDVVFFERNGLRHGQFDLRLTPEQLKDLTSSLKLKWNSDSNVLAVCYPKKAQLWTMSNYHYYLKQEVVFPESDISAVMCKWHPEKPLSTTVATSGSLQILEYLSAAVAGSVSPPYDFGTVASIDGLTLHITPLRVANVPPPMSLLQLPLQHAAVDVAISKSGTQLAVLSNYDVSVYALDITKRPVSAPRLLWRSDPLDGHSLRQVSFIGDDKIFVLTDSWDEEDCSLWESQQVNLFYRGRVGQGKPISGLFTCVDSKDLHLQFLDGEIHVLEAEKASDAGSKSLSLVNKFPSFAPDVRAVCQDNKVLYFGLTKSGILYANERVVVRNCTSFTITPAHLIFTTTQHYLKFVHLTNASELEIPADEPQKDERCRSIERGARIVTVMPTTYSVVLQMPRGNLETIYPRALVLAAIRRSIQAERYDHAFLTCRTQRVDMNILHDHAPEQFMRNIALIVDQIKRVDHLDLLLSQLRDEDVSETMYKETLTTNDAEKKGSLDPHSTDLKVNRICDGFLAVLQQEKYKEDRLQNIITAHVCKNPSDLETALEMISQLQDVKHPLTEKAAEHICFLADVNKLYDTALGIYKLDLALLIAQESQKDPREYLPYLQALNDLPLLRRKFTIDDQLGRQGKALQHLQAMGAFEEIPDYVVKHSLYVDALNMYQYDNVHLNEIMRLYADYLSSINQHKDASIAYEYLSEYSLAWQSYRAANLWRESLSCATLANLPEAEFTELATTLAESLVEAKDYLSASTVYLDYLSDITTSAKMLCKGYFFAEAVRIVTLRGRPELITEVIDPGLIESSASMTEFLAECKGQLQAQVPRLLEVRKKKEEDPMAYYDGIEDNNIPDNISLAPTDTTSGGTFMTRYTKRTGTVNTQTTRRTSKNRRREERKRARGKKGSVYEEEYLMNSIERLITRVNGMNDDVTRLVEGLTKRRMRERASAVTQAMQDVINLCKRSVGEVYTAQAVAQTMPVVEDGMEKPVGGDAVLWASLEEGTRRRDPPVLVEFKDLSLLG
ncbi:elongator complex protein 1 [Delitschia confertaspora ATCC 74209]|uniref:Elongator complex protein 1 n=1 Tax=Delitschia confertaspora ATCC 74209 TaxID=1513339 RepID=A0A9P4JCH2_9PLEO|nr:elongator complex protein 1 [Delitschia confertaspora ATCC 74209]